MIFDISEINNNIFTFFNMYNKLSSLTNSLKLSIS